MIPDRLELELTSLLDSDQSAHCTWDRIAGTFTGRDGALVEAVVADAVQTGHCISHPWPTRYVCANARHDPVQLAPVLNRYWQLPPDLAATIPLPAAEQANVPVLY